MRVDFEKDYLDIYRKLAKDINDAAGKFRAKSHKISPKAYEKLLFNTNISIEKKKKELVRHLHKAIVETFSIDLSKVKSKKTLLGGLKNNLLILRATVNKLRLINHYLEENLLKELGLVKKRIIMPTKKTRSILTKKSYLGKKDLERLEHTVYMMIEKVIFLDKRLLKGYKKREENIIRRKKAETRGIEDVLKKESEILMHLEAKLPPAGKVKPALLKKQVLHNWAARVFALLSGFENEYRKEGMIFNKLKRNEKVRKKVNKKIKHILKEKEKLLKLKQQRALSMKKLKIDNEWRSVFYQFNAAARL